MDTEPSVIALYSLIALIQFSRLMIHLERVAATSHNGEYFTKSIQTRLSLNVADITTTWAFRDRS